jgi:hypothetical protein
MHAVVHGEPTTLAAFDHARLTKPVAPQPGFTGTCAR